MARADLQSRSEPPGLLDPTRFPSSLPAELAALPPASLVCLPLRAETDGEIVIGGSVSYGQLVNLHSLYDLKFSRIFRCFLVKSYSGKHMYVG